MSRPDIDSFKHLLEVGDCPYLGELRKLVEWTEHVEAERDALKAALAESESAFEMYEAVAYKQREAMEKAEKLVSELHDVPYDDDRRGYVCPHCGAVQSGGGGEA